MGAGHSDMATLSRQELVARIRDQLGTMDPQKAKALGGTFLFAIMKGQAVDCWTLDLDKVAVYEGEPENDPDCVFTLTEHNFRLLVSGKEDPRTIVQGGRCSVTGDIMRAMQLEPYIKLK